MSNVTSAEVVAAKISRGAFDRAMKSMPSFRGLAHATCRHAGEFHLSDISAALVGCRHVSGLFVWHGRPLALMPLTSGPDPSRAFRDAAIQRVLLTLGTTVSAPDMPSPVWALIEPMIPPAKRGGRRREVNVREVLNAIFYVLSTGCQWQALPKDLPPKSTAHHYFGLWDWDGTLERVHHALYVATRERAGREASPTAAIIDSQSGKAAQKGALRSTRKALMRPRRSPAANVISWSTRWASS